MGFKQTTAHRNGKGSYHQIGLVRGQFGNVPEAKWIKFVAGRRLRRLGGGALGARPAPVRHRRRGRRLRQGARRPGQEARPGNLHRRHPPPGPGARRRADAPRRCNSARQGEARAAYKAWRDKRQQPAAHRPVLRPRRGRQADPRRRRSSDLLACVRLRRAPVASCRTARWRCPASSARRPTAGATGSCSRRCPTSIDGPHDPGRPRRCSLELLVERFGPVLGRCARSTASRSTWSATRASGRWATSSRPAITSTTWTRPGYEGVVGFNLDGSHMEWQNVSVVQFIREFPEFIHCAHVKGVWVAREHCRAGRLGGHRPMGHWANGWNFVTAGTARDANSARRDLHRAEPRRLRRRGVDRVGGQRRRAARRGEGGAGQLPQGRPARPAACGTTRCSRGEPWARSASLGYTVGRR